jgi:hypothetical protein
MTDAASALTPLAWPEGAAVSVVPPKIKWLTELAPEVAAKPAVVIVANRINSVMKRILDFETALRNGLGVLVEGETLGLFIGGNPFNSRSGGGVC